MLRTKVLIFAKVATIALVGAIIGYGISTYRNYEPLSDGQLTKEAAAKAVAIEFARPKNQHEMANMLLGWRTQRFYGGTFSCIKFYPGWQAYGYMHVACDFGDGRIQVVSF